MSKIIEYKQIPTNPQYKTFYIGDTMLCCSGPSNLSDAQYYIRFCKEIQDKLDAGWAITDEAREVYELQVKLRDYYIEKPQKLNEFYRVCREIKNIEEEIHIKSLVRTSLDFWCTLGYKMNEFHCKKCKFFSEELNCCGK